MRASLVCLLLLIVTCSCHSRYASNFPNGGSVVRNGVLTPAVGHNDGSNGGGPRNVFGSAYGSNSAWSSLCVLDSDGDGFSNGMELGDPFCVWTVGATPSRTTGISHPGFSDSIPNVATTTTTIPAPPTPVPSTTPTPPTTTTQAPSQAPLIEIIPITTPFVAIFSNFLSVQFTVSGLYFYVNMSITGDRYGAMGFSATAMDGPIVLCYVANSNYAICRDYQGQNLNIVARSTQSTAIAWGATSAGYWVTARCPVAHLGLSNAESRAIFCYGTYNVPLQHANAHLSHSRRAARCNPFTGYLTLKTTAHFWKFIAYIIVGVVSGLWLLTAVIVTQVSGKTFSYSTVTFFQVLLSLTFFVLLAVVIGLSYLDFVTAGVSAPIFKAFGEGTKFIFVFLFIPVPKYISIGKIFFGMSVERALPFHILMGITLVVVSTVHFAGITVYFTNARFTKWIFAWQSDHRNLAGFLAWIFILLTALPAMFLRRQFYSFFRVSHFLFLFVVVFAVIHQYELALMLIPGILFWLADVGCRAVNLVRAKPVLVESEASRNLVTLKISTAWRNPPQPGQYCFLHLSAVGVVLHPFTVATYANRVATFYIKPQGKGTWTGTLHQLVIDHHPLGDMMLMGPFGTLMVPLEAVSHAIVVAGGIGVTPMLSIAEGAAKSGNITIVDFVWSCRDEDILRAFEPLIASLPSGVNSTIYCTSGQPNNDPQNEGKRVVGRPNFSEIFAGAARRRAGLVGVYICGPEKMMNEAAAAAINEGFLIHTETFNF